MRSILSNHEKKVSDETEERVHELKQKVFQATFEQLKAQVEEDLRKIRAALPTKATQALETSKDMKYIRDRQQCLSPGFQTRLFGLQVLGNFDFARGMSWL